MGDSVELRNAKLAANATIIGNAGILELLTRPQPATGGAKTTVLARFTLGTPFEPTPSNGVQSPTLPTAVSGLANGVVAWARIYKSDGATFVRDLRAGAAGSGAQVILNTTTISTGSAVSITSWQTTAGDA